jgi:hypothetical protein
MRRMLLPLLLFIAVQGGASAQDKQKPDGQEKPYDPVDWHLSRVPAVLYSQMPQLQGRGGVVVEKVVAGSRAEQMQLEAYDILLSYDGRELHNPEQFYRIMREAKPDAKGPLTLLRGGKEKTLQVALNSTDPLGNIKGAIKPGGPPSVAIEYTVLDDGKLQIVLGYYPDKSSKLETVTCKGSLPEIEQQLRDRMLPSRVQDLVDVAIKQLKKSK